jgi:hypothetical protein
VKDSRLLHQLRQLFNIYSIEWRFARTGHTSFFIYDTYGIVIMLIFCWIILLIGYLLNKKQPRLFKRNAGMFYTLIHKAHEISILYIFINTILEWFYFHPSFERFLSLGLCLFANIYFIGYELYIYHDMIKYPTAAIGNAKYEYYAIRYGSYLKHIRYE